MPQIRRRLAIGTAVAATGVLMVGVPAASASSASTARTQTPVRSAGAVRPLANYMNCTLRVDVPQTDFNTGISVFKLMKGWQVYSDRQQDLNQNLWYVYSFSFGIDGWVDWHDLHLVDCDP
jgi:hypothetical protein